MLDKFLEVICDRWNKKLKKKVKTSFDTSYDLLNGYIQILSKQMEFTNKHKKSIPFGTQLSRFIKKEDYFQFWQFCVRKEVKIPWLVTDGDTKILDSFERTYLGRVALIGYLHYFGPERRSLKKKFKVHSDVYKEFNELVHECVDLVKKCDEESLLEGEWFQKMFSFLEKYLPRKAKKFNQKLKHLRYQILVNRQYGVEEINENNNSESLFAKVKHEMRVLFAIVKGLVSYSNAIDYMFKLCIHNRLEVLKVQVGIPSEIRASENVLAKLRLRDWKEKKAIVMKTSNLKELLDLQKMWTLNVDFSYLNRPLFLHIHINRDYIMSIDVDELEKEIHFSEYSYPEFIIKIQVIVGNRRYHSMDGVFIFGDKEGFCVVSLEYGMFCWPPCPMFVTEGFCEHTGSVCEVQSTWDVGIRCRNKLLSSESVFKSILCNDEGLSLITGKKEHKRAKSRKNTPIETIEMLLKENSFFYEDPEIGYQRELTMDNLLLLSDKWLSKLAKKNQVKLKGLSKLKDKAKRIYEDLLRDEFIKKTKIDSEIEERKRNGNSSISVRMTRSSSRREKELDRNEEISESSNVNNSRKRMIQ